VETLIQVLIAVALIGAFALCVTLIICVLRFYKFLQILQIEIVELNRSLKPILDNLSIATEKFRLAALKIEEQVNIVHSVFIVFRKIVDNVGQLEERFQKILEDPIMRVGALFGGVINRVVSFFSRRSEENP